MATLVISISPRSCPLTFIYCGNIKCIVISTKVYDGQSWIAHLDVATGFCHFLANGCTDRPETCIFGISTSDRVFTEYLHGIMNRVVLVAIEACIVRYGCGPLCSGIRMTRVLSSSHKRPRGEPPASHNLVWLSNVPMSIFWPLAAPAWWLCESISGARHAYFDLPASDSLKNGSKMLLDIIWIYVVKRLYELDPWIGLHAGQINAFRGFPWKHNNGQIQANNATNAMWDTYLVSFDRIYADSHMIWLKLLLRVWCSFLCVANPWFLHFKLTLFIMLYCTRTLLSHDVQWLFDAFTCLRHVFTDFKCTHTRERVVL